MEASSAPTWAWIVFGVTVVVLLVIDLYNHHDDESDSRKKAAVWTVIWIAAGLLFNMFVWWAVGAQAGKEYLATYFIEKSLSLDNLFVFLVIFHTLSIPEKYHHKVLYWGIFGAIVFRAIFILLGVQLVRTVDWIPYVFGAILLYAAYRTFMEDPTEESESSTVNWLSKHLPLSQHAHEGQFIARENGKRVLTSLGVALVAIEVTDVMFAIDSVAAALSFTQNEFVLYSSNVFAILGLRALYLLMEHSISELKYLHYGLAAVLGFAGLKMLAKGYVHVPPLISVGIIAVFLGVSVWASYHYTDKTFGESEPETFGGEESNGTRGEGEKEATAQRS